MGVEERIKVAQEALWKSEERFRNLMEQSPLAIAVFTTEGQITQVNTAWTREWGVDEEEKAEILARYNLRTDRQLEDLGVASLVERAFAGESVVLPPILYSGNRAIGEMALEGVEARSCWIQCHLYPVKDAHGRVTDVVCTNMDITELKRATEELESSEARFRGLMEQSPLAIEILNPEGKIEEVNSAWLRLWGINQDQAAQAMEKYNMLTDRQTVELGIAPLIKEAFAGEPVVLPPIQYAADKAAQEFEVPDVDASAPWIQCHLSPVKNENQEIAFVVNTYVDITKRKQIEDALRVNERRLSLIYESVAEVLFSIRVEPHDCFRFVSVNPAFSKATGLREDQIVGKRIDEVIPEDSLEMVLNNYRQSIKANKTVSWEETSVYPTGEKTGIVSIAPVLDENGICTHLVGSVHDITERKQAEKEMSQLRSELVHATRTGVLGEMTAALAHELNHPLGSILNNANAAKRFLEQDNPDLDEIRAIIGDIISENRRANEVMQRVRNLMKKTEVGLAPVQINSIIEEVVDLTHSEFVIENVSLSTKLAPGLPQIAGERIQLQQVFINLIMNGIDAMKGRKNKEIRIFSEHKDADTIVVRVSDTGVGFSGDKEDLLFKPFFTTKKEGMGMGLSVTRTIIKAHGGEISADNNKDAGASFYISLPVHKESTE